MTDIASPSPLSSSNSRILITTSALLFINTVSIWFYQLLPMDESRHAPALSSSKLSQIIVSWAVEGRHSTGFPKYNDFWTNLFSHGPRVITTFCWLRMLSTSSAGSITFKFDAKSSFSSKLSIETMKLVSYLLELRISFRILSDTSLWELRSTKIVYLYDSIKFVISLSSHHSSLLTSF